MFFDLDKAYSTTSTEGTNDWTSTDYYAPATNVCIKTDIGTDDYYPLVFYNYDGDSYVPREGVQCLFLTDPIEELYSMVRLTGHKNVSLTRKCFMQLKTFKNIRRRR